MSHAEALLDTSFVTIRAPWTVGLTFLGLEVTVVICGVLALLHALGERRRGDGAPLFVWGASFTYGIVMELLSYNFVDSFAHGQFTVMFYRHQLPLYVVTLYPVLQYTSIMTARRLRLGLVPEAFAAGLSMVAMDAPFDILGAHQHWWTWSASDPNVAFRWHDVPVTSYYWHLAFGGILAGLTRAFGRYGGEVRRPWRIAILALPVSFLTIVLGVIAFLPFHFLKARGVADGTVVAGLFVVGLAVVVLSRRAASEATPPDGRLFTIALVYYAYFALVAFGQLAVAPAAFAGRM
ncbi:MAG TPA: hypothetical protein VIF09_19905, partial [Polyangiaceae bacterium]